MPIDEDQRRREWEALLLKNDSSYYRDNNGQIRRLKDYEYIDQYGNLQKRYKFNNTEQYHPHCTFIEPVKYKEDHYEGDGVEDLPLVLKLFISCFVLFCFLVIIVLLPIHDNVPPVIITEKTTAVVDSVSAFDANQEKDLMTQIMDEKKQQIAEVNEEIKKIQEKKVLADTLKANKKELLTMTAMVDDGFTTREIKAEAEVDSITDDAINMLSQSLQTTVDSIALQVKLKSFMEQKIHENDVNTVAMLMKARNWKVEELMDMLGF